MAIVFAWDNWNKNHVTKHGSSEADAKYVVEHAEKPFPREIGNDKFLVWGQTAFNNYLQVIFASRYRTTWRFRIWIFWIGAP